MRKPSDSSRGRYKPRFLENLSDAYDAKKKDDLGENRTGDEFQDWLNQLERFRALLDHASDGIFLVDLNTKRVVDANNSACGILGLKCPSLLGRRLEEVMDLEGINWLDESEGPPDKGMVSTLLHCAGGESVPVEVRFNMDQFGGAAYGVVVARDVTLQRRVQTALKESEEQLQNLMDSTPLGIHLYRLDEKGRLIFTGANPAADSILGIRHENFIGQPIEEAFPGLVETEVPFYYRKVCRSGKPWRNEQVIYQDKAVRGAFEVHAFSTGAGRMAAMFMDISERKRAEAALLESSRMKSEFISTTAHELRTPLTSIRGFAQLLVSHSDLTEQERKESLAYIHQKAEALSRILDDLLDIARVESGQALTLKKTIVTIDELLQSSMAYLKARGVDFQIRWTLKQGGTMVLADRERVDQIMENLLSNALKYSPEGTEISVSGRPRNHEYLIIVEDRGIGMTPEQIIRIFDKFFRADSSNTAVSGLGLGMSIVKDLVESHGGRIWVESRAGEGTRVHFTLPIVETDCPEGSP